MEGCDSNSMKMSTYGQMTHSSLALRDFTPQHHSILVANLPPPDSLAGDCNDHALGCATNLSTSGKLIFFTLIVFLAFNLHN